MQNLLAVEPFDVVTIFKSITTRWYLYVLLAVVIIAVLLFSVIMHPKKTYNLTKTQVLTYSSMLVAFAVVSNIIQIPFPLVQISLVATVGFVSGVLLGPVNGFFIAFLGDLIAGIVAPLGIYSPIIGIGTAMFGFVPGVIFCYLKSSTAVKAIISYAITFIVTTVIINTFGICMLYSYAILAEEIVLLPLKFAFHCVNCALSILLINEFRKLLPKNKFFLQ